MEPGLSDPDSDKAEDKIGRRANGIGDPQAGEVIASFDKPVGNVGDEQEGHDREDPLMAGVVIAFETVVFADLIGEEERTQEVEQNCVDGDEEINGEGPLAYLDEVEFPPPEMDQVQEEEEHPDEMDPIDSEPPGMLDDERYSFKQVGHTEAHDHSKEHSDVKVKIHRRHTVQNCQPTLAAC